MEKAGVVLGGTLSMTARTNTELNPAINLSEGERITTLAGTL